MRKLWNSLSIKPSKTTWFKRDPSVSPNSSPKLAYALDHQYLERVYAGVLGKIIGVYLGRPFEGWEYEQISNQLGDINYYVMRS